MRIKIQILLFISLSFLSACAFYPTADSNKEYVYRCKMISKKLKLSSTDLELSNCASTKYPDSCLAALILVPATTFIVSGSIVLIGNTIHWIEYNGFCNEELEEKIAAH